MSVFLQPIYTQTVGAGGAATVTFNNIPQTFTDLKVVISARGTTSTNGDELRMRFNSDSGSNYNWTRIYGDGGTAYSQRGSSIGAPYTSFILAGGFSGATTTANTFGTNEVYIANYAGSNYKSTVSEGVAENNAASGYDYLTAGLWLNTAAITSITFVAPNAYSQYSTFSLYGVLRQGI